MLNKNLIVDENENVLNVMKRLDENGLGIVFVNNSSGEFIGVITDGDLRRGLLAKARLDIPAGSLANRDPIIGYDFEEENEWIRKIKDRSSREKVSVIPILNSDRKLVNSFLYREGKSFPISAPQLQGNELKYVIDCIESNWISSQGQYIVDFENYFARTYGAKHALTVMNGTVALHLALHALGIGPGDEVLVPTLTFAASVNAILYTGATPVLVDVDLESWCIDCEQAERLITKRTRAIMPVHIYGQPSNMDRISTLSEKYNLKIVEDCAEAQGAKFGGRFVGTIGDVGCFSFFANKIMTTGEGGMCLTNNTELYQKMKMLRDHGIDRSKAGYQHAVVGFNYRMTNLQAAIGLAQMEKINELQSSRQRIENQYNDFFKDYSQVEIQKHISGSEKVCWLVSVLFRGKNINRDRFITLLKEHSVDARAFFTPMHQMEIYKELAKGVFPKADAISKFGLNLPTSSSMSEGEQDALLAKIKMVLEQNE